MLAIPAIDLKEGKCVRLAQGEMEKASVYSNDPIAVAQRWEAEGAKLIHIIDLDGASRGQPQHKGLIRKIIRALKIPVQLGGGIRELATIRMYREMGVERIILGTRAIEEPPFLKECCRCFPSHLLVSLDARDGFVASHGWKKSTNKKAVELARSLESLPLIALVYTDIRRDGTLSSPNIEAIEELARATRIPLIASGGIASREDIKKIKSLEPCGVVGFIIGRALYDGRLNLGEAIRLANKSK